MLHVLVGAVCNNNCQFCMEADRVGRQRHIAARGRAEVWRELVEYPRRDGVLFTSGEPTTEALLPEYVERARDLGYGVVALITNGRRLAYAEYARELLERGLNQITVSVHGFDSSSHDAQTRTRGSFEQTQQGLRNLTALRATHRFGLRTSSVLTRRTLARLKELFDFLSGFPLDVMVLNVPMAKGRAAARVRGIVPSYAEVVARMHALCGDRPVPRDGRVRVKDVPPCAAVRLPAGVWGEVEEYAQFEPSRSTGLSEVGFFRLGEREREKRLARGAPLEEVDELQVAPAVARLTDGPEPSALGRLRREIEAHERAPDRLRLIARSDKDSVLRAKRLECARCAADSRCRGVWTAYVEAYGWVGLEPLDSWPHGMPPS